jgi:hypothetical protein
MDEPMQREILLWSQASDWRSLRDAARRNESHGW